MRNEIHFRPATPADWPQVSVLLTNAQLPLDGAEEHLENFLLAFHDNQLVGSAGLEKYGRHGILRSVAVDASERGSGLGQTLVQRTLEHAKAQGVAHVILLTTTAQDFFPRFGFRQIARAEAPAPVTASVEFQGACPASATVMQLDL
jgi:amino-acid N-acetyltransferase